MPLTQTKKKKQPAKFQVGDKVYYQAYGGGEYPGVVTEVDWMHYGRPVYRINIPDFRGKGPADISSFEDHVEPGQKTLFAAKTPKYQVGDQVEYIGDTNEGVWVVTRAKYRPQTGQWIYWIRPKDYKGTDKYMPSQGMSVWQHDIFPVQQSLDLKEKPEFITLTDPKLAAKPKTKPVFNVGDEVHFKANPQIKGTIAKIKGGKWEWEYYVRYKHPNQDKMVEHSYSAFSLAPAQQSIEFNPAPGFEVGEWVGTKQGSGEILKRIWSKEHMTDGQWEYLLKMSKDGNEVWYGEDRLTPLDRPALSKKQANWIEKSRDMYRFEQKPIGKDRKQILGPELPKVKNTFLELPVKKEGKSHPRYLQGDTVSIPMGTSGVHPGTVRSYFWSNEHQAYFYRVDVDGHEIGLWEIQIRPAQQRLFAMKVNAGEVLPFDPSKRKHPRMGPGVKEIPLSEDFMGLPPELQEERDAIFYEYDNTIINLQELYKNMQALGETEIANNIRAALQSLTGKLLDSGN